MDRRGRRSTDISCSDHYSDDGGIWFFYRKPGGGAHGESQEDVSDALISEDINELFPLALDSGMSVREFEESSLADILDFIESYNRRKKADIQLKFIQAEVMVNRLCMIFDEKVEALMPWDYYPQIFQKERNDYIRRKEEAELAAFKEKRRNAMDEHNARRHSEEVRE